MIQRAGGILRRSSQALLCALLLTSCGQQEEQTGRHRMRTTDAVPVAAAAAVRDSVSTFFLATTSLEAERSVQVLSKVTGIVSRLAVEEGDQVKADQLLAQLDEQELVIQHRSAKIQEETQRRNFERARDLFERKLISKENFEDARTAHETAEAQFEAAELQLAHTRITSPIAGIVTGRMIEIGDRVNVNQTCFAVADFDPLLARIYVPEREITRISPGQLALVSVEAARELEHTGRVQRISPIVEPNSGTIKVTVEIRDRTGFLRPGMFATVRVLTERRPDVLTVPKKALLLESERDQVYVVREGRAALTDLELGISEGGRVEVLKGLAAGDLVVTLGQDGLRNGVAVKVIEGDGTEMRATQVDSNVVEPKRREHPGRPEFAAGGMDPERMARMEQMMMRRPEIKEEYEKRLKDDPELATDPEKKAAFFMEMREKVRGRRGR